MVRCRRSILSVLVTFAPDPFRMDVGGSGVFERVSMDAGMRQRFASTALKLGATPTQAILLSCCAVGWSYATIKYQLGIKRPSVPLCKLYATLGANHRGHAIAIVFEAMYKKEKVT